jgi:NAD(P)-dependent dehydrogenase (short-subunit alcohol dehydrogenase family)
MCRNYPREGLVTAVAPPARPAGAGRLAGKVALVVGAGSAGPGWGNGRATAVLFAREGAAVVAVDRDADALESTAAIIREEGFDVTAMQADVSSSESTRDMVARTVEVHGRLDVLHNNVGILRRGGVVDQAIDDWNAVLAVNLTGAYLLCKAAVPAMVEAGGGSIVNVASVAAIRYLGVPYVSYSASKAGLLALTQSTAVEFAPHGVRVNAISPGYMDTPMVAASLRGAYGTEGVEDELKALAAVRQQQVPMGRMGDAWDVAHAALFLASDEASYITGTQLVVDGGLTAKC